MSSENYVCNMKVLRKTRRKPEAGDYFCLSILPGLYHFGRVIKTDASIFDPTGRLIYIYKPTSESTKEIPQLSRYELLVPPLVTNDQPWTRGYFQFIDNQPLEKGDYFSQHCFYSDFHHKYFNEYWDRLSSRTEPCGDFALYSFVGIDKLLSDALCVTRIRESNVLSNREEETYTKLMRDTINENELALRVVIPYIKGDRGSEVPRDVIEDLLETQFSNQKLATWSASGSYEGFAHIDYDVMPGRYPEVCDITERVLTGLGIKQYRILVQDSFDDSE